MTEETQSQIDCPDCGMKKIELIYLESSEDSTSLNMRCSTCGSLFHMMIQGKPEKENLTEVKKKEVNWIG